MSLRPFISFTLTTTASRFAGTAMLALLFTSGATRATPCRSLRPPAKAPVLIEFGTLGGCEP